MEEIYKTKKTVFTIGTMFLLIFASPLFSQNIGINSSGSAADGSAGLDIDFTNKGTLNPRLTTAQRDAIASPAEGLLIYNLDCHAFNYYNGTAWVSMNGTSSLNDPGTISGSTSVCSGATGETYSISAVTGATSYSWTVPTGAAITAGQGTTSITVTFGSASGDICVTASNDCFTSDVSCTTVTVSGSGISLSELKAYYKFNEASGNIINQATAVGSTESLGAAADMVITGATYSQSGKVGNSLDYDGTNDHGKLSLGSAGMLNFLHTPNCTWSISVWVYHKSTPDEDIFFGTQDPGIAPEYGMNIIFSAAGPRNRIMYTTNSVVADQAAVSETYDLNTWTHYAFTYDQTIASQNTKIYKNGSLLGTKNKVNDNNTTNNHTHTPTIGVLAAQSAWYLNARLDEMSIWNRVLDPCEVDYLYNSGNGRNL